MEGRSGTRSYSDRAIDGTARRIDISENVLVGEFSLKENQI
jgi:hypothetical protein